MPRAAHRRAACSTGSRAPTAPDPLQWTRGKHQRVQEWASQQPMMGLFVLLLLPSGNNMSCQQALQPRTCECLGGVFRVCHRIGEAVVDAAQPRAVGVPNPSDLQGGRSRQGIEVGRGLAAAAGLPCPAAAHLQQSPNPQPQPTHPSTPAQAPGAWPWCPADCWRCAL